MDLENIAFIGSGNIAEALLNGFISKGTVNPSKIVVTNRTNEQRLNFLHEKYGVNTTSSTSEALSNSTVLFLLMKPKDAKEALQNLKEFIREDHLIVSVIAGVTIESILEIIDKNVGVVRTMPNTSATIGKSATGISFSDKVTDVQKVYITELFNTVGITIPIEEYLLDSVTGLAGSGPAFVYYFVESLLVSGEAVGLSKEVTEKLTYQMLLGAAEMLFESGKTPRTLRKEVTSPNGTTEAGLKKLDEQEFQEAIIACVKRATERSHELSKLIKNT